MDTRQPGVTLAPNRARGLVRWRASLLGLLVALAAFAGHLRALDGTILRWDDWDTLVEEQRWRGLTPDNLGWMFTTAHRGHFQPLTWISYALEYELFGMEAGLEPRVFHATNLVLHALVSALVFWLASRIFALAAPAASALWRDGAAALAALLFALHPLRVESVAWITERRDVLSGVFFVGALIAWIGAGRRDRDGRLERRGIVLSFALMVLCVLSKAFGMVLPALFLLLDWWPLRRHVRVGWRRLLQEKLPFLCLSAVVAVLALRSQEETGALAGTEDIELPVRLRLVVHAFSFYPWKTLLPLGLSPLYSVPCEGYRVDARLVIEVLAAAALFTLAWVSRRRFPAFTVAWCAFVITVLPVSGIALSGPQAAADRYSYLSCLGFAFLAGSLVLAPRLRKATLLGGAAAVLALAAATWRQTAIWKDDISLWTAAIAAGGPLDIAYGNRGVEYLALRDFDRAEADFRAALEDCSVSLPALVNLAFMAGERGNWEESVGYARRALALEPDGPLALQHLGRALMMLGQLETAQEAYARAIRASPADALLRYRHADLLHKLGRTEEACAEAETATRLQPQDPLAWAALAQARAAAGQLPLARAAAEEALLRQPDNPQFLTLAGETRLAVGDRPAAREAFERLLELRPGDPQAQRRLEELR